MLEGQLLAFRPSTHSLVVRTAHQVVELNLPLYKEVRITFHPPKMCIGYYDGNQWQPCPYGREGPQCRDCWNRDMKKVFAVRDIRGFEEFYEKIKDKTYSIYLALYGSDVKVGVTSSARLEERLREQGALHYVEVFRIRGMDRAYEVEEYLMQALGLKGSVSNKAKLNGQDNLERLREAYERVKELGVAPVLPFRVRRNYIRVFPSAKRARAIEGKVLGFRGNLVFFKGEGGIYYDVITYHIGERVKVWRI